jgi:hypothetical protein
VTFEPHDERRHESGADAGWSEWWALDYARDDGFGGFVRLAFFPNANVAWYWAYVVEPGAPGPLVVRDHEVALPRGDALEVRAEGLWAECTCETPFEHWSYGLEAFAVRLDDPDDAYRGEIGERVPLGLDLEWEEDGAPAVGGGSGYEQRGVVHGEVLIGRGRVEFDGSGVRSHGWGAVVWPPQGACDGDELARVEVPLERRIGLTRRLCRDASGLRWLEWLHE